MQDQAMRVLRLLRPARSAAAVEAEGPSENLGLDAFATEAPPPSAHLTARATDPRLCIALVALAVVAVLESVPAFLWVQTWLKPVEPAVLAATPMAIPVPVAVESVTPPCAPAPSPGGAAAAIAAKPPDGATATSARAVAPAMMAGLVSVEAPVPMHVYSDARLVGTTEADTIMLPVGTHDLELVSETIGFRARRSVSVQAGRTTDIRIEAPRVPVHVNAVPWAEVWIDNQRVGETPIGNLQQTIGTHEIVFRHPELGERRMMVLVTLKEPVRISMDLRKR
jgi:hypothetical protein